MYPINTGERQCLLGKIWVHRSNTHRIGPRRFPYEGWIKVPAGKTLDRKGKPLMLKLKGKVEAFYR